MNVCSIPAIFMWEHNAHSTDLRGNKARAGQGRAGQGKAGHVD